MRGERDTIMMGIGQAERDRLMADRMERGIIGEPERGLTSRPLVMAEDAVRTLTMGFWFRVDESVSKDTMVQMCGRISEMFGDGHEFRPLGNKGILSWRRWPGQLAGIGSSLKEMRLVIHPKRPVATIAWPEDVGEDVLERWQGDESLCLRRGLYKTQLVALGDAKNWRLEELEVIREVFRLAGWRVGGLGDIRGLGLRRRKAERKRLNDSRYVPTEARAGVLYRDDVRYQDGVRCAVGVLNQDGVRCAADATTGNGQTTTTGKRGADGDIKARA